MYQVFLKMGHWRPTFATEFLTFWVSLGFALFYNTPFWKGAFDYVAPSGLMDWLLVLEYGVVLVFIQFVVFVVFVNRWSVKPFLIALIFMAAAINFYTTRYGVYFNTDMVNNVLQTDAQEANELLTLGFLGYMCIYAVIPSLFVAWVRIKRGSILRSSLRRLGVLAASIIILGGCILLSFQSVSALMRTHHELRFLVTPGNAIVSSIQALAPAGKPIPDDKIPLESDAVLKSGVSSKNEKPELLVIVVGETMRAANWGLNGYERQTTPKLAERSVVNYPNVTSCGTSTAVSLPCMFSPLGHDDYDEWFLKSHESLLDVLKHAGIDVRWFDNQSGCKGVCDSVKSKTLSEKDFPDLCASGRCYDEALVKQLQNELKSSSGDGENKVVVLHQLGNHGPSYFERYPEKFKKFVPTCNTAELNECTRKEIVNAYDNGVLYTDSVLDGVISVLTSQKKYAAAMIYVADHGESLGENGIYLHGLPYSIAPDEQTHVPMTWWMGKDFLSSSEIDKSCLLANKGKNYSHANLFSSILGLMQVTTSVYKPEQDITSACRT
ncbi:phosphoethanolamine--lipid A transferase [Chromohalobacter sp. HP20-39]|uniref:phosphoethanolamine transferase n=1 Tax=Chromohalobacter sp. HP20-39 TaxID=3079306 RepID=UPI00294B38DA|nr:phosphoethanolamine--lipid A transferase [Chromohalobacter sp. HP20-39]MDV6320071.1 phosphoethanolamine--lipid A transferase [Chromohalobacter sp. HP20-39]